jgi:general secretion pathway protein G
MPQPTPSAAVGPRSRRSGGFTLIELMIAIAIVGILSSIATVRYLGYIEKVRVTRSILDLKTIQTEIDGLTVEGAPLPANLAAVNLQKNDPWGFPYRYLPLRDALGRRINFGAARKDRFLVPINDDYDLYSIGMNGQTAVALTSARSRDDVIRANDGAFLGLADRY